MQIKQISYSSHFLRNLKKLDLNYNDIGPEGKIIFEELVDRGIKVFY